MTTLKSSGYASVNGLNMYYEIHGEGVMPLVLIHGGGSTIESNFGVILPLLAANYKIVTMELQAHGRTGDRDAPESFVQDADDVFALLQYLKITKADVLGFSNGGSTTMQLAIRHPEMVNKIIVASGAYKREGFITGFFEFMPNATIESMPAPLKEAFLKVTPDQDKLLTMFNKDKARMVTFKDWEDDELKSIKAKTMIISADQDVILPEHALKMSRLIPNAQLVILPGVHGAYLGEICAPDKNSKLPEITASIVSEFLK